MERELPVEVTSTQTLCESCARDGYNGRPRILIRRVAVSQIRAGWTVSGAGSTHVGEDWCPQCGAVCQVITTRLPVELAGVPCPTCKTTAELEYDLNCVETDGGAFTFTATVRCPKCAPRTFARRIVQGIRRIKHLKLGPTGIEVDLE